MLSLAWSVWVIRHIWDYAANKREWLTYFLWLCHFVHIPYNGKREIWVTEIVWHWVIFEHMSWGELNLIKILIRKNPYIQPRSRDSSWWRALCNLWLASEILFFSWANMFISFLNYDWLPSLKRTCDYQHLLVCLCVVSRTSWNVMEGFGWILGYR